MKKLYSFNEHEEDLDWSGFVEPTVEEETSSKEAIEKYTDEDFDKDVEALRHRIIELNENPESKKEDYKKIADELVALAVHCTECYVKDVTPYAIDIKSCVRKCHTFYKIVSRKF